jgi:hypothetical protein
MASYRFDPIPVSDADKQRYVDMMVTLDGKPAKVCGRLNDFATVRSDSNSAEFSWYAVRTVIENRNGEFSS